MNRFLFFSHDTYGLGHFRRCALLAAGLTGADPANEVLIVTGSPRAQSFRLPERVDTVKLPTVTKDSQGCYRPRKLSGGLSAMIALRGELIATAAAGFRPDVVVVDHAPLGMGGELRTTLDLIETMRDRPRLVLGLRDIIDDPDRVDTGWQADGTWDEIDRYDDVFVYGDPSIVTTADEMGLADRTSATVTHTGYLAPAMPAALTTEPFLLVTPGGGGDGQGLLRRYLEAVESGATDGMRSLVVTGPLLSTGRRAELLARAAALESVDVIEFSERMRTLIASARGVVSMAGYNTVVEELAAGTPSLLVPRSVPRLEQHLRATRLAPITALEHCPLDALDAERIQAFSDRCRMPTRSTPGVDLRGVSHVVAGLRSDLATDAKRFIRV